MIELELDPPSTAFPAAISSIAAAAKPAQSAASGKGVHGATPTASIEASPSFMFTSGLRSSFSFSHEGFGSVDNSSDHAMVVDARKDDQNVRMDES